jgi:hypothetical protein
MPHFGEYLKKWLKAHHLSHHKLAEQIGVEPRWPNGSLVEFRCLRDGMHHLEVGRSYYVQRGDEATFKRLEEIGEDRLTFHAINGKKYPAPIYVDRVDIVRMAVAEFRLVNPDIEGGV